MTTFERLAKIVNGEVAPKNWVERAFKNIVTAVVPDIGAGDVGKFLKAGETGAGWDSISQVPTIAQSDRGKFLRAGSNFLPQWYTIVTLPSVGNSDKGKYLHTNDETGAVEWNTVSLDTGFFDVDFNVNAQDETATSTKTAQEIFSALSNGKTLRGRFIVENGSIATIAGVVHGATAETMKIYSIAHKDAGNNVTVAQIRWYNDAWVISGFGSLS